MKLAIQEPCPGRQWSDLDGDGARRYCADCDKHVVDLSAMSLTSARSFLADHPDACVRFETDADGQMKTRPESRGGVLRRRLLRRVATVALGSAMSTSPALASGALATELPEDSIAQRAVAWVRSWVQTAEPVSEGSEPACESGMDRMAPLTHVEVVPPESEQVSEAQPAKSVIPEVDASPPPVPPAVEPRREYLGGAPLELFD